MGTGGERPVRQPAMRCETRRFIRLKASPRRETFTGASLAQLARWSRGLRAAVSGCVWRLGSWPGRYLDSCRKTLRGVDADRLERSGNPLLFRAPVASDPTPRSFLPTPCPAPYRDKSPHFTIT